jgi:hypothetical protein
MNQTDHLDVLDTTTGQPRDLHHVHWLWIDNTIVDRYGEAIGAAGLGMYAALARYANQKTGQCWPSLERLSTQLDCTRRSARRYLHRLVTAGLITLEERPGHTFLITLVDLQAVGEGGEKSAQVPTAEGEEGGKKDTPGGQKRHPRGAKSAHELSQPNQTYKPSAAPAVAHAGATGTADAPPLALTIDRWLASLDAPTLAELDQAARTVLQAEGTAPAHMIRPTIDATMQRLWEERAACAAVRAGLTTGEPWVAAVA